MSKGTVLIIGFVVVLGFSGGIYAVNKYVSTERQNRAAADAAALLMQKKDISVTIIEGKRREEIALLMDKAGICPAVEFMLASAGKEGTLFPDTYRFFPHTPARDVVATLMQNYKDKTSDLEPSTNDLILASIVEREAYNNEQRPIIAGVYSNRIKIGMRLEADPTVQYSRDSNALGSDGAKNNKSISLSFSFWSPITQDDYHGVSSLYNTYTNDGLPPTPIDNPGRASIVAAVNPAKHNYLYFINKGGKLLLSKTLTEHQNKQ
jgi:UPF0755 protein